MSTVCTHSAQTRRARICLSTHTVWDLLCSPQTWLPWSIWYCLTHPQLWRDFQPGTTECQDEDKAGVGERTSVCWWCGRVLVRELLYADDAAFIANSKRRPAVLHVPPSGGGWLLVNPGRKPAAQGLTQISTLKDPTQWESQSYSSSSHFMLVQGNYDPRGFLW